MTKRGDKVEFFPFQGAGTDTDEFNKIITKGSNSIISNTRLLEKEIEKFKTSDKRKWMIEGERYYEGEQDILSHKRKVIGNGGRLVIAENLPNNQRLDNQYAKLVDQKVNYQLGKPLTLETEDETYLKLLQRIFNKRFHRTLRNLGLDALNGGIAWLYPYYNEQGEFTFKRFLNSEILPFWKDAEHTILDSAVRMYTESGYEGDQEVLYDKVEVYTVNGVKCYVWFNGRLVEDVENPPFSYLTTTDEEGNEIQLNWQRVPLIPFKFNSKEIPLIKRVKSLQDGINLMLSIFENNMQEDARSTILILHNYDGQNLGEFRRNLSQYGAVKVRSADGSRGGVESLQIDVNSDNYKAILSLFKKALIENGRGYDAKDERMANNPNQMNIQSMYSDIDLDANGIETEFQASFEELLWFVNMHLVNTGKGDFEDEEVNVIFNRDILINETESINNIVNSTMLSTETLVSQHPWIKDVQLELDRIKKEKEKEINDYRNAFPKRGGVVE
ncbi:phage portal protein [Bacillus sp. FJAT-22090]|uniref:phage portal protein n=1 Tax=Bacillus sp. FJAT-22090 TaxID=1581038 RepID=UPI001C92C0B7|nr:phage portal protein [Bacillus sp. FJAT-22090]